MGVVACHTARPAWFTYVVYCPSLLIGLLINTQGFQMYKQTKFFFGFGMSFFSLETYLTGATSLQLGVVLTISFLVGIVVGTVVARFEHMGMMIMEAMTGGVLALLVLHLGVYDTYCGQVGDQETQLIT